MNAMLAKGLVPMMVDIDKAEKADEPFSLATSIPKLMGQCAGHITEVKPAKAIVEEMVADAITAIRGNHAAIAKL
jgi:hypothetical protein